MKGKLAGTLWGLWVALWVSNSQRQSRNRGTSTNTPPRMFAWQPWWRALLSLHRLLAALA